MRKLLTCLAIAGLCPLLQSQTLSLADGTVLRAAPNKMGGNIGDYESYSNGSHLKNLFGYWNPNMEPLGQTSIWQEFVAAGTNWVQEPDQYDNVAANYWQNGVFTVAYSGNASNIGCTATISGNNAVNNNALTPVYTSGALSSVTVNTGSATVTGSPNGTFPIYMYGNGTGQAATYTVSGGVITSTTVTAGGSGYTSGGAQVLPVYGLNSSCPVAFQAGDIWTISTGYGTSSKYFPTPETLWENGNGGVSNGQSGGGKLTSETTNLCATCGVQSLRMDATTGTSGFSLGYDSQGINVWTLMNGTYQLSFWAKTVSGTPALTISGSRGSTGGFSCGPYTPALTTTWQQFTFNCTATETQSSTSVGGATWTFSTTGGANDIDNLSLVKTSPVDATNTSIFKDEAINNFKAWGITQFRYWLGQNGETMANWTAQPYARTPTLAGAAYNTAPGGAGGLTLGLNDYLNICKLIGASPYLEVPVTFTTADAANLIEFLASPTTTSGYGQVRANLGQTTPWTTVFSTIATGHIFLSFCNECWNANNAGAGLGFRAGPVNGTYFDYGNRAAQIYAAQRAAPDFNASVIKLGFNALEVNPDGADAAITVSHPDYIEIASYDNGVFNSAPDWQTSYAYPYINAYLGGTGDKFYESMQDYTNLHQCGASGTALCQVDLYEWGNGASGGTMTQLVQDQMDAGAAYGVQAVNKYLINQQAYGIESQNYFAYSEYLNGCSANPNCKLYGSIVDEGGSTNNVRPVFLAMELMNKSIIGSMYSCPISSNITYNYAGSTQNSATGGTTPAVSNLAVLYAYCFKNGSSRSLVLVNTDLTAAHTLTFAGTNVPTGTVTTRSFAPTNLTDMNEAPTGSNTNLTAATVALSSSTAAATSSISLPAHSVIALDYTTSATAQNPVTITGKIRATGSSRIE